MSYKARKYRLSRSYNARGLLVRNLTTSLIREGKIKTTLTRAKTIQPFIERLITFAKKSDTAATRLVESRLGSRIITKMLVREIAPRFPDQRSGFTRIIHIGERLGDRARMALLEFTAPPLPKDLPASRQGKKVKEEKKVEKEIKVEQAKKTKVTPRKRATKESVKTKKAKE